MNIRGFLVCAAMGIFAVAAGVSPVAAQTAAEQEASEKAAEDYFKNLGAIQAKQTAEAEKGCAAGDMKQCVKAGKNYSAGRGVPVDGAKALAFHKKACTAGEIEGCFCIGSMLYFGKVVPKDIVQSGIYFEQACKAGYNMACFNLAGAYARHTPAELQTACDNESVRACNELGLRLGKGKDKDMKRAAGLYERACKLGWEESCANLGTLMVMGEGVAKDPQQGVRMLTDACDKEVYFACNTLGAIYGGGHEIPADKEKAIAFFNKACTAGLKEACNSAAALTGNAVKGDAPAPNTTATATTPTTTKTPVAAPPKTQTSAKPAAAAASVPATKPAAAAVPVASPAAATKAGTATRVFTSGFEDKPEKPRVLPPPGSDGQKILDTCDANGGGAKNCFDLAHAYANGLGVEESFPLSMMLFKKACDLGHQAACKRAYGADYDKRPR